MNQNTKENQSAKNDCLFSKENINIILEKAESLLQQDREAELEYLKANPYGNTPNYEKYESAKAMFESILSSDPINKRALDGLSICDTMLTPYIPVQYIAPIFSNDIIASIDEGVVNNLVDQPKETPWEYKLSQLERDREGMEYTGQQAGIARKKYMKKADAIIEQASKDLKLDNPHIIQQAEKALYDLQDEFDQEIENGDGVDYKIDERADISLVEKLNHFIDYIFPAGSVKASVFNLCSATLGAGCIALPYVIAKVGILLGALLLIFGCVLTIISIHLLIWARNKTNQESYEDLAIYCFGVFWAIFVEINIILFCYGTCVGYFIAIGDILTPVAEMIFGDIFLSSRYFILCFAGIFIMFPLSCFEKINSLRFTSLLGVTSILYLVFAIFLTAVYTTVSNHYIFQFEVTLFNFSLVPMFQTLPVIMFTYTCQVNVFSIFIELQRRSIRRMDLTAQYSMSLSCLLYILISSFGYVYTASVGDRIDPDILNNFSITQPLMGLAQACLALTVVLAYPLNIFPMRFAIEKLIFAKASPSRFRSLTLTAIMVFSSMGLALITRDINIVFGLVGAICSSIVCFIFPGMYYLNILYKEIDIEERPKYKYLTFSAYLMIVFGVIGGLLGTYADIRDLI